MHRHTHPQHTTLAGRDHITRVIERNAWMVVCICVYAVFAVCALCVYAVFICCVYMLSVYTVCVLCVPCLL